MKFLNIFFIFAVGAVASLSPNGQVLSLDPRDGFCGYDAAGNGWECVDSSAECCPGTGVTSCMPQNSKCCTTGYYCDPDEECFLDTVNGIQYCRKTSGDAKSTRTAESQDAKETGSKGGSSVASSTLGGGKALAIFPVVMGLVALL